MRAFKTHFPDNSGPRESAHSRALPTSLKLRDGRVVEFPAVMGVVNVTPDSFSDGGRYLDPDAAIGHGLALIAEGAHVLDVGGESTRPGAEPVTEAEERARVVPVVAALAADSSVPVSIDTTK